jgi:SAM-dependent methyltransferase
VPSSADLRRRTRRLQKTARRAARLVSEPERIRPALARRLDPSAAPPRATLEPKATQLSRPRRLALITRDLDMAGLGLEIGPSHNPLLLKSDGHNIRIADHLDQAGLIAKYEGVRPTGRIEDVDYVLSDARLTQSIGDRFDYILGSHLAEHTVCLITFLQECKELLLPGGRLSLALPDKRYCFDRVRERTALGRVIDVYRAGAQVHSYGSVIEHNLNMVTKAGAVAWFEGAPGDLAFRVPLDLTLQRADVAAAGEYIDTHNWVLTPHHFRLLLHDLHLLGFIELREHSFVDTIDHEFFITLSADGAGPGVSRAELVALAANEVLGLEPVHLQEQA